jgi:DNA-binding CsgD family transcriptional regulator
MRLTQRQQTTRQTIERLVSASLEPVELAQRICAALSSAIPNDGYRMFGVDPSTLLINRLLAASDSDERARRTWLHHVYLTSDQIPYVELPNLMRLRLPVVASQPLQSICWGYPSEVISHLTPDEHERAFHEIGSPLGGTILASFASRGSWVAAMQIYRRDPLSPFSRSDVAFLRSLATTIGDALAAAFSRERALQADPADDEASGILLVHQSGLVTYATPAGEAWLDRLRVIEPTSGTDLPTPVVAAIAGLRTGQRPSQQIIAPLPGGSLQVEASAGGPDTIAIVLSRRQAAAPPTVPIDWPLTPQERQITLLLIQGKTNRAISETLFISENTVLTHLRHIYAKLGVSGRTQLLARIFHESADIRLFDEGAA